MSESVILAEIRKRSKKQQAAPKNETPDDILAKIRNLPKKAAEATVSLDKDGKEPASGIPVNVMVAIATALSTPDPEYIERQKTKAFDDAMEIVGK
jgi:hypothetical protein